MKKILLTLILVIASITITHAQVWLGGSVNGHFNKEIKAFSIAPEVGYYFTDTPFTIGCGIEYSGTIEKGEAYTHSLTIAPFLRYDICDIGERFTMFVDLYSDIEVLDFSFFDIGLAPGISFDLTEHWSADFSYGFLGYQREKNGNAIEHGFVLDFKTATAEFGIYYSF